MNLPDPLGVPGAPRETWTAVQRHVQAPSAHGGQLILVTDRQGERQHAAYGALLERGADRVVLARAFGPHFGPAGIQALAELVAWAVDAGLALREAVLPPPDAAQLLSEPDAALAARAVAASAPLDPGVFLPGRGRR
ncbi:DUF3197 domain-containing protein [Deinococcus multiflagellatus]|uniref:DUF3197 domain-containing protein n=1 Tax=Deinococcus multiflagellatus TaxID=1656887 RepID=A0ABW1ZNB8_9DEIO|nr:DUF3197 domain-containing protein [Deinococcus multiflagellatus]MBZ9715189.1 DUF3197 domain-containing protein [Deinococcus multiflagellatus]